MSTKRRDTRHRDQHSRLTDNGPLRRTATILQILQLALDELKKASQERDIKRVKEHMDLASRLLVDASAWARRAE